MQRKTKIVAAILVICAITIATVAAVGPYFASYTRNISWTVANTQFELDVNGTQQLGQIASISIGAVSSADSYCEVYTLTNLGDVPINITSGLTPSVGGAAVYNWLTGTPATVTLGPTQSADMVLLITDFTQDATLTVSFNSVKAFISDPEVFNFTQTTTGDVDTGVKGNWAMDSYSKNVQVYSLGGNNYVALVDYVGTWTIPTPTANGGPSPQAGTLEKATATGPMIGSYVGTFTATGLTAAATTDNGKTITKNLGGTTASITSGLTYGTQSPAYTANFNWYTYYVNGGSAMAQPQWGWTYLYSTINPSTGYSGQMWNNYASGTNGDIIP